MTATNESPVVYPTAGRHVSHGDGLRLMRRAVTEAQVVYTHATPGERMVEIGKDDALAILQAAEADNTVTRWCVVKRSHGQALLEHASASPRLPDGIWSPIVIEREACSRCHRFDNPTFCDWYDLVVCAKCHKGPAHDCYHNFAEVDELADRFDKWMASTA